jgi:TPR repeat protein
VPAADAAYGKGDYAKAAKLWREACEAGNATGCYELAIVYRDGEGVTADPKREAELLEQSCAGGEGRGCFNLAFKSDPDPKATASQAALDRARGYFERGCEAQFPGACFNVGEYYLSGRGVTKDVDRALGYMERACLIGTQDAGPACFSVAAKYDAHDSGSVRDDPARANRFLELGCGMGEPDACRNLGDHYKRGFGLPQNWARARALFATACADANEMQCLELSPNEHFGGGSAYTADDVEPQRRRAAGLYVDACKDGLAQGCASLAYALMRGGKADARQAEILRLLDRADELGPKLWLTGFLREEVAAGRLSEWDRRARERAGRR